MQLKLCPSKQNFPIDIDLVAGLIAKGEATATSAVLQAGRSGDASTAT